MSKSNEADPRTSSTTDFFNDDKAEEKEEKVENEKAKEEKSGGGGGGEEEEEEKEEVQEEKVKVKEEKEEEEEMVKVEEEKTEEDRQEEVLRFTMLFNKYNGVLDVKRSWKSDENKSAVFFNKVVTIRQKSDEPSPAAKILESKNAGSFDRDLRMSLPSRNSRSRSKFCTQSFNMAEPQISDPEMMFSSSLTFSSPEPFEWKTHFTSENLKRFLNTRNPIVEADPLLQLTVPVPTAQTDLRPHNSLTSLSKDTQLGLTAALKSKIPSLTALDTGLVHQRTGLTRFGCWEHWDDLTLMQSDVEKRLSLQVSRSSNDNNRRSVPKFKKEDAASVSDSKLLYADLESKKHIKKCDKKSRGDSSKKEKDSGSRKQVQWKTEVDVIYFSTHLAANGDRTGEVLGRVMEPLREEWEQQRKGFYAKLVSSHIESHLKDRFISLLNI